MAGKAEKTVFDLHAFMHTLINSGDFGRSKYQALINLVDMLTDSEVILDSGEHNYEQSFLLKIYNGREKLPKQIIGKMQSSIYKEHIIASLKDYISEDIYAYIVDRFYSILEKDPYITEHEQAELEKLMNDKVEYAKDPGQIIYSVYRYVILNEVNIRE